MAAPGVVGIGSRAGAAGAAAALGGGEEQGARVGKDGTGRGRELGKTERAPGAGRAGGGGQRPQPGGGEDAASGDPEEFIQRVQAMKSPDHNGEENLLPDFAGESLLAVASSHRHPSPLPLRPLPGLDRRRFVCGCKERGGEGGRANPKGRVDSRLGGEDAPRPPFLRPAIAAPSARVRNAKRGRWPSPHLAPPPGRPPIVSRAGSGRRPRCRPVGSFISPSSLLLLEGRGRKESG